MKLLGKNLRPFILTASFVLAVMAIGCNNSTDTKEVTVPVPTTEAPVVAPTSTTDSLPPIDDSASTRPVNVKGGPVQPK